MTAELSADANGVSLGQLAKLTFTVFSVKGERRRQRRRRKRRSEEREEDRRVVRSIERNERRTSQLLSLVPNDSVSAYHESIERVALRTSNQKQKVLCRSIELSFRRKNEPGRGGTLFFTRSQNETSSDCEGNNQKNASQCRCEGRKTRLSRESQNRRKNWKTLPLDETFQSRLCQMTMAEKRETQRRIRC